MKKLLIFIVVVLILSFSCQSVFAASLLKSGSRGSEVRTMQQALKDKGYLSGRVDGIYGKNTLSAVKAFQRAVGLKVDGIAGSRTFYKLYSNQNNQTTNPPSSSAITSTLKKGSRGSQVVALQTKLKELGLYQGRLDGIFGSGTYSSVRAFQSSRGLKIDGIVGHNTVSSLFSTSNNNNNNESDNDSTSGSSGSQSRAITSTLKKGSRGTQVNTLQTTLKELGFYSGRIDGIFGRITEQSVKRFQSESGLSADGIVGRRTITALFENNDDNSNNNDTSSDNNDNTTDDNDNSSDNDQSSDPSGDDQTSVFTPWKPDSGKISLVWITGASSMKVDEEGINVVSPVWFYIGQKNGDVAVTRSTPSTTYIEQAHSKGYKVWATIQSFNRSYSEAVLTNSDTADRIVQEIVDMVQQYGIDGLNIDFENLSPELKDPYSIFVEKAVAALHAVNVDVSVDITKKISTTNYDRTRLAQAVDYVMLMSYDEHWSSCNYNGPVASIGWVEDAVNITLEEVPKEKLLLGIPLYAYDWALNPNVENPDPNNMDHYDRPSRCRAFYMDELQTLETEGRAVLKNGNELVVKTWLTEPVWLDSTGTMYMKFIDTADSIHEIWYENPQSIGLKLDLIDKYNLAGACSWQYVFANDAIWDVYKQKLFE